tara:strand:- start:6741 stop:8633 length:1893 start_codon:yes stop_codon:yes gene_type:complete
MPRVFSTPGVFRRELDLSEILVATGISTGAIVVRTPKGPIRRPVQVTNDKEYIEYFGNPVFTSGSSVSGTGALIPEFGYGSYGAIEFLKESTNLFVVRAYDFTDKYAAIQVDNDIETTNTNVSGGITPLTATPEVFDTRDKISSIDDVADTAVEPLLVSFVSPGIDGNDYAVTVETLHPDADWLFQYDDYPTESSATTDGPNSIWTSGTSADIAVHYPKASKVFKLKLYQKPDDKEWDELYSNSADKDAAKLRLEEIESYYATLSPTLDGNGTSLFAEDVVNGNSKNIYVKSNVGQVFDYSYTFSGTSGGSNLPDGQDDAGNFFYNNDRLCKLSGGTTNQDNGLGSGDDEFWTYFNDREELQIQILVGTSYNTTTKQAMGELARKRLDCIGTVQAGTLDDINFQDVLNAEEYGYVSPSYIAIYCGYSRIYDKINDKRVFLPNSIYGASLYPRVDNIADPWSAPAGVDRATLAVFDQKKVYNADHIGKLYDKNINCVRFIRGTGFVMWGQKTAQQKKSALDRISVRRNLLFMENNIEIALFPFTFENNTVQTRLRVFSLIDNFLAGVQAGGGLTDYEVVVDETNNTPTIIDSNQMNVDVYVQPTRTAEFIQFTTIVTRTGISFSDVRLKYS